MIDDLLSPLWLRYPSIPMGSIGWRMGAGEEYMSQWNDWFSQLTPEAQLSYRGWFPPAPTCQGFYDPGYGIGYGFDSETDFSCTGPSGWSVVYWQRSGLPRYSRQMLIDGGWDGEFVFFWKPEVDAVGPGTLSQWQPSAFRIYDDCCCAEQYMMAEKARLFGDTAIEGEIMATDDPKRMKSLGRRVANFDATLWDKAKYSVVLDGNYAKFTQDETLREYLLSTTGKVLVEASPMDTIWGIGLSSANPKAADPAQWRGQNLLGFALMEVRDEITRVWANYDRIDWSHFP